MGNKIFKLLCMVSLITVCISSSSSSVVFASENTTIVSDNLEVNDNSDVIGNSYSTSGISKENNNSKANLLPNVLTLDWDATENGIYLYFTNIGLDSIDTIGGTISTGNATKSFSYAAVSLGQHAYYVSLPVKTCSESISISYFATDGGTSFGSATSYGSRAISSSLVNMWSPGSMGTRAACLNYHFKVHGAEVGASNIADYVRLADFTRINIISQNISPERVVSGVTANTYRYLYNTYYLHVVRVGGVPTGDLVSFGLAW